MPPKTRQKSTKRYSLDMDREQLRFLKLFALQVEHSASAVMRVLVYLLETNSDVQYAVIDEIYPVEGEPLAIVTNVSRKGRNLSRFTLDLHVEQSKYLRFVSINQGIDASIILRVMVYLLESNKEFDGTALQDVVENLLEQEGS